MQYNDLTHQHFFNSPHVGVLTDNNMVTTRVGTLAAGNVVQFYLLFDEQHKIINATFKAHGGVYIIAGASLACELLQNKTISEARQLTYTNYAKLLDIPSAKLSCAIFIEDAVNAVLDCIDR